LVDFFDIFSAVLPAPVAGTLFVVLFSCGHRLFNKQIRTWFSQNLMIENITEPSHYYVCRLLTIVKLYKIIYYNDIVYTSVTVSRLMLTLVNIKY